MKTGAALFNCANVVGLPAQNGFETIGCFRIIYWNLAKCSTDCIGIILKGVALTICRVCRIGAGATVADRLSSVRVL